MNEWWETKKRVLTGACVVEGGVVVGVSVNVGDEEVLNCMVK